MEKKHGIVEVTYSGQSINQQSVDKAIIIIPGVMGSRLFTSNYIFDDTTRIWDPVLPQGYDWNDMLYSEFLNRIHDLGKQFKEGNLYPRKMENQNVETGTLKYGREYGAQNTYKNLVDILCEKFPDRKIYFFSYDWRQSNTESAMELYRTIYRLGIVKADLVCHSMGGLVASKFYMMYRHNNQIDKIITCATPYEGAPKLLNSIINKDILGEGAFGGADWKNDLIDIVLGTLGGMSKELKSSFQGVAELLPTKNYVSEISMQEVTYKYNVQMHRSEPTGRNLSYEEYIKRCESVFDNNQEVQGTTYNKIKEFQESILAESGHNALLDYNKAYFAVGINYKTITSIRFFPDSPEINQRLYETDLNLGQLGDGTVPFLSATMMDKMSGIAGVGKRCWFFSADHSGIIKSYEVIEWITHILTNGYSDQPSATLSGSGVN